MQLCRQGKLEILAGPHCAEADRTPRKHAYCGYPRTRRWEKTVASPRKLKNPTMSVTVVKKIEED